MPILINNGFKEQLRRNSVALISLFIAVSSLSYNTWRNERSEYNRNQRLASIQVLLKLGELQELVFHNHYDGDSSIAGNPRTGWALVLTIQDLSQVLESPLPESADTLSAAWASHWNLLGRNQISADAILDSIEDVRDDTKGLLRRLD